MRRSPSPASPPQSDTREALIAALEAQLAAAVATQDFEAASCVSAARAAVLASDDAAAFLGAFADATRREDFPAAAALRDAGAGLVGWWAGVDEAAPSAPGHSPTGVLLRIAPRFGRLVGTAHAPGEPGVSASSFWAVAAARAAGAPLPSASDGVRLAAQPAPSPVIELHVVSRAAEAGGCGFATTAAVLVPPEGGLAPLGLRPPAGDDGLDDADDGGGVVNITVFLSGKESPDDAAAQLGAALASTLAATPPDTGAALGAGGARRRGGRRRGAARRGALARPPPGADASSRSDEDDDDTAEEDGEEEGEEGEEEEEEDTDSGLSPEDRAPPPPPPPRRAPATLTRVGRDTFTLEYSAAAPDERDVVAGARAASLSRSAPAAPDRRAQLLAAVRQVAAATLSGAKGRISVTLGSPTSPFPFASFPLAAAAAAAAMAGSSPRSPALPCRCVFRRIPPSCLDSPTDPLSGLATGIFGPHGTETLLLRRGAWGYEPGEGDAPPAAECFTAFKLTGDKHVPAGRASFRARVGRGACGAPLALCCVSAPSQPPSFPPRRAPAGARGRVPRRAGGHRPVQGAGARGGAGVRQPPLGGRRAARARRPRRGAWRARRLRLARPGRKEVPHPPAPPGAAGQLRLGSGLVKGKGTQGRVVPACGFFCLGTML